MLIWVIMLLGDRATLDFDGAQLYLREAVHVRDGGYADEYYSALPTLRVIGLWTQASSLILKQ